MGRDLVEKCCRLSDYCVCEYDELSWLRVQGDWRECFSLICKEMGFRKKDSKFLWHNLANGNWVHFHTTEEENNRTAKDWMEKFSNDLFYCSDRWSFDRLTRVHWLFKHWFALEWGDVYCEII